MTKRAARPVGNQKVRVSTGVYLKSNGTYLSVYRNPGGKQVSKTHKTMTEAIRWRARAVLDPASLNSGKRTLEEVWTGYMEDHAASLRRGTRLNWEQEWSKHIAPALGSWPIGKISIPEVKSYLASLGRAGVGTETRKKCRMILHRLLQEAVENGELPSNPVVPGTRIKSEQTKKARILSATEVREVIAAAKRVCSDGDSLAIEIMFWLGLRPGEMAGLQAGDLDLARGTLTVQRTVSDTGGELYVQDATKTNCARTLPLPSDFRVRRLLVDHVRAHSLIGQAHLFQAPKGGPIRPNNWRRRVWDRTMDAAGIVQPPTPHSGRRTTSSLLAAAGVPPFTIQKILGHSSLEQTGGYVDVPVHEMENAMRALARMYATG